MTKPKPAPADDIERDPTDATDPSTTNEPGPAEPDQEPETRRDSDRARVLWIQRLDGTVVHEHFGSASAQTRYLNDHDDEIREYHLDHYTEA